MTVDEKRERIAQLTRQIAAAKRKLRKLVYERCVLRRALTKTGTKHSEETKAKMRAAAAVRPPASAEARRAMSEAAKRRAADPQERERLRQMAVVREIAKRGGPRDPLEAAIFGKKAA